MHLVYSGVGTSVTNLIQSCTITNTILMTVKMPRVDAWAIFYDCRAFKRLVTNVHFYMIDALTVEIWNWPTCMIKDTRGS